MDLVHVSPVEIVKISGRGLFDGFLFFSSQAKKTHGSFVYSLSIDESEIIAAKSLFYHADAAKLDALVADFCERYSVSTDTAEEIISERSQLDNCDADASWDCQLFTAKAAKILGFRGVEVSDEYGSSYIVLMMHRENELKLEA